MGLMFQVLDDSEECLWDFRSARTLSVFGSAGSGKSILARHVVKTWIRYGGTVLVGSRFHGAPHNSDYGDLEGLIHVDTAENAVGYARTLEGIRDDSNLLIVVDDWTALSDEDMEYLDSRPDSDISWVVVRQKPRNHHLFDNIGVGRMTHVTAALGFGSDHGIEDPHAIERGVATQLSSTGGVMYSRVPRSATMPMENESLYARRPLPALSRRLWYAE